MASGLSDTVKILHELYLIDGKRNIRTSEPSFGNTVMIQENKFTKPFFFWFEVPVLAVI